MGVPVHASVSGTVKQIGSMLTSGGKTVKTVVIEADGQQEAFSAPAPVRAESREAFLQAVRESGLVGLAAPVFPLMSSLLIRILRRSIR